MPEPTTVFVFDANQRSALAVVRSLGKHTNIKLICGDETPDALAAHSRYCSDYYQYPSPYTQPEEFLDWLQAFSRNQQVDMLFPVTEVSSQLILMHSDRFSQCNIPYAAIEQVNALANKWNLVDIATQLGVPCPATKLCQRASELNPEEIAQYPVVLKPCMSRLWMGDRWLNTTVHIAQSEQDLKQLLADKEYFRQHPFMLQEFIPGTGAGVFTLYNRGQALTFFGHRRLREKPPSGGVSVLSQGDLPENSLIEYSTKLLDHVGWHGVAMIEYRLSAEGKPYLMEVNTRFWGSLQLAIDCGVDFPYLLFQLATGQQADTKEGYRTELRLRWLLGDLDRLYILLKDRQYSLKRKLFEILIFLTPSTTATRYEINRWGDMKPALYELKKYISDLLPGR